MVEVLPEIALLDLGLQILVGRGDNPHINHDVLVTPDSGEFLLLQDSENLCLRGKAHVTDFVKK